MSEEAIAGKMQSLSLLTAEADPGGNTVLLKCADGVDLHVWVPLATQSRTIKNCIDDVGAVSGIRLHEMRAEILLVIIEYWRQHLGGDDDEDPRRKDALEEWDRSFVNKNRYWLTELLVAANFLDSPKLVDVLSRAVANQIMNMTVEEVREYFGIECDFTPEEEAKLREQNRWAF